MNVFEDGKTDTSIRALTPEGIEYVLFSAGLPIRACAYGIDQALQWTFILAAGVLTHFLGDDGGIWLYLILIFCVDWFYHIGCELLFRGQSLGKRIMGIRVVQNDGAPVNPGASFLRNLLRFADTFLFLCPIAFVSMAASRGFRRLGDWAAGTLVVYTSKSLAVPRYAGVYRAADGTVPVHAVPSPPEKFSRRPLGYEERQAILMFARRYPLLGEARADEIARPYAASLRNAGSSAPEDLSDSAYLLRIAGTLSGRPGGGPPGDRP
ncbi:MAG: RDD family protein [Treponema sp.]|jgi:uncharacterized RDD family membrane protein YckC|nr:RDD family protein [Treponema sp.]